MVGIVLQRTVLGLMFLALVYKLMLLLIFLIGETCIFSFLGPRLDYSFGARKPKSCNTITNLTSLPSFSKNALNPLWQIKFSLWPMEKTLLVVIWKSTDAPPNMGFPPWMRKVCHYELFVWEVFIIRSIHIHSTLLIGQKYFGTYSCIHLLTSSHACLHI